MRQFPFPKNLLLLLQDDLLRTNYLIYNFSVIKKRVTKGKHVAICDIFKLTVNNSQMKTLHKTSLDYAVTNYSNDIDVK